VLGSVPCMGPKTQPLTCRKLNPRSTREFQALTHEMHFYISQIFISTHLHLDCFLVILIKFSFKKKTCYIFLALCIVRLKAVPAHRIYNLAHGMCINDLYYPGNLFYFKGLFAVERTISLLHSERKNDLFCSAQFS
jgi:hypothetical protein